MAITYKGVNIKRENNKYTLTWSLSSTNNVKDVKTRFSIFDKKGNKKILKNDTVGKNVKSKSFKLDRDDYFPVTKKECVKCV